MQRLSNWFEDHLPLRRRSDVRRSERGTRRKASKSAAPRMRYSVSNAQKQNNDLVEQLPFAASAGPHTMSVSMIGKESIYDDGYTGKQFHVTVQWDSNSSFRPSSVSQLFR